MAATGALIPAWDAGGTLRPMDKIAVHRRGLRHPAVSVFVMAAGQLLLQRRALGKYHTPGLWANSCCTHPHWGEDPATCAARRLGEELGLTVPSLIHRGQIDYRADVGGGMIEHEAVDVFRADLPAPPALSPDPAEVMEVRWITPARLMAEIAADPTRFTPWLRLYLSDHHTRIFGRE